MFGSTFTSTGSIYKAGELRLQVNEAIHLAAARRGARRRRTFQKIWYIARVGGIGACRAGDSTANL
jgi:hypothetical protein